MEGVEGEGFAGLGTCLGAGELGPGLGRGTLVPLLVWVDGAWVCLENGACVAWAGGEAGVVEAGAAAPWSGELEDPGGFWVRPTAKPMTVSNVTITPTIWGPYCCARCWMSRGLGTSGSLGEEGR